MAFAPDGSFLLTTDNNQTLLAVLVQKGALATWSSINTGTIVYAVAFSPTGTTFVTGNADNTATLRKSSDGAVVLSLWTVANGHTKAVTSVAFSPDGHTIATGSLDGTIKLWNAADGTFIQTLTPSLATFYSAIAFTADSANLISLTQQTDPPLALWSLASGTVVSTSLANGANTCFVLSPDGGTVYAGGRPGIQPLQLPGWAALPLMRNPTSGLSGLSLSADGARLAWIDGDEVGHVSCLP